jgi:ankyrin repeat protein
VIFSHRNNNLNIPSSSESRVQLELGSIQLDMQNTRSTTLERLDSFNQKLASVDNQLVRIRESAAQNKEAISKLENTFTQTLEQLVHGETGMLGTKLSRMDMMDRSRSRLFSELSVSALGAKKMESRHKILPCSGFEQQRAPLEKSEFGQSTFSIWAIYRNRTCPNFCNCACHSGRTRTQTRTWKTPFILTRLLGSLFSTYTGYPIWSQACDSRMCHRRGSKTLEVVYEFPLWCVNRNIHALFHTRATGSPAVSLVFRQRVPYRVGGIFPVVDSNNIELLRAILRRNPDSVNYRLYKSGHTALHFACLRPQSISFEVFQLLLRAGADLHAESDDGRSVASIIACQMLQGGFSEEHEIEISKWGSISQYMEELELSPVTEVAVGLRVGEIESLLWKLPPSRLKVTEFDNTGSTPLYWASRAGNLGAVQALVSFGVDINQKNALGNTPLIGSFAFNRGLDCFRWLLDNGSDPYQSNNDGYNALTSACYFGRLDVVKHMVACWFHPDTRDGKKRTGLCCAVSYDHDHIVDYLFSVGANADVVNDWGFVPVLDAVRGNSHKCLRLLLKNDVNYRFLSPGGWSVLHCAAAAGDVETMEILAKHSLRGVDVHGKALGGFTAEDMFLARRSIESDTLIAAFRNLLARVGQATNELQLEIEQETRKELEEMFFDAVEY